VLVTTAGSGAPSHLLVPVRVDPWPLLHCLLIASAKLTCIVVAIACACGWYTLRYQLATRCEMSGMGRPAQVRRDAATPQGRSM
jgi:hypothetical protein